MCLTVPALALGIAIFWCDACSQHPHNAKGPLVPVLHTGGPRQRPGYLGNYSYWNFLSWFWCRYVIQNNNWQSGTDSKVLNRNECQCSGKRWRKHACKVIKMMFIPFLVLPHLAVGVISSFQWHFYTQTSIGRCYFFVLHDIKEEGGDSSNLVVMQGTFVPFCVPLPYDSGCHFFLPWDQFRKEGHDSSNLMVMQRMFIPLWTPGLNSWCHFFAVPQDDFRK